jgi:hypothetical protein
MADPGRPSRKLFTVEQANAMLPLVRAITSDLASLSRDVSERRQRLSLLLEGREPPDGIDPYREELARIEEDLVRDCARLREYADELAALGVEPKSAVEGLVDFPAVIDGRAVYLCWKLGEPRVLFWHDPGAGYAGRRRLPTVRMTAESGSR